MRPVTVMDHNRPCLIQWYKVRLGMPVRADASRTDTKWMAEISPGWRMDGPPLHTCASASTGGSDIPWQSIAGTILDRWSTVALLCNAYGQPHGFGRIGIGGCIQ